jgi:D-alanine--poly(phosphoribitol) ligase subunit 1
MGQSNLWRVFLATAARRAAAPALALPSGDVSFTVLKQTALRGAAYLAGQGVTRGDIVALQIGKRLETYALMLACLRLGAVYVCLDPKNPAERTRKIVTRIEPKLLFTETPLSDAPASTKVIDAASFQAETWPAPVAEIDLANESNGGTPAYLMFTSGSTGEPKGAVIPQMGIASLMAWSRSLLGDADQHRFTGINPLHFDNSVFDFYCGLLSGATLVPVETSQVVNPLEWATYVTEKKATVFFAVPTLFLLLDKIAALTPVMLPNVRNFLFGGEGFPIETLRAFHKRFLGQARLINVYGPTETSCICSSLPLDEEALTQAGSGFVSLGRMHENFSHAVLDPDGKPVGTGEPGELWIGGPCVGLGYYRQPEETARRFQQDPRQSDFRAIMYRTGDLVREAQDGNLWFVGRADNQVKIAGHRIELEEIDFAVQAHEAVRRAVAVVAGKDDAREIVVAFEAARPIPADELAAFTRTRLPAYMQPRRFEQLAELPRNANGKVDRIKSLSLVSAQSGSAGVPPALYDVMPSTTAQRAGETPALPDCLREIWASVLNLTTVPTDANFFDLGGTSLLMIRVHTEIKRRLGREVSTNDLFANPKIQDLVRFMEGAAGEREHVETAAQRGARQRELMQRMRKASTVPQ